LARGRFRAARSARWLRRHARGLALAAVLGALGAAAALVGPGALARVIDHPYFGIEEIVVSPTARVRPGELLSWARIRPGMSVWRIDPERLEARIAAHPWVRRTHVRRELPRRLTIEVHERRPVAVAALERLYYVDRDGVAFASLADGDVLDLPLITGLRDVEAERPHAMREALKVLRLVEARGLSFRVSEVHIEEKQGIRVFPVEPAVALTFGWGRLKDKTERLATVLESFAGREMRIAEVDLTFAHQAVIRLKQT
jgi:cell division septal protein FtsQ